MVMKRLTVSPDLTGPVGGYAVGSRVGSRVGEE